MSDERGSDGFAKENTHDIRDLAERLLFQVLRRLVLAFHEVDDDQFKSDVFLVQDSRNAARAGRLASSVKLEDHCDAKWWIGLLVSKGGESVLNITASFQGLLYLQ